MDNRIFGYARVSSADQNLDRQLDALGRFPVQRDLIYTDKASGRTSDVHSTSGFVVDCAKETFW